MHTPRRTTAQLIAAARALQVQPAPPRKPMHIVAQAVGEVIAGILPAPTSPPPDSAQPAPALAPQATADETPAPAPQVVHPAATPRKRRSKGPSA